MNIEKAQKFLKESGKEELSKVLFYDAETKTSSELMATLLEEYHQSEVLKLNINLVSHILELYKESLGWDFDGSAWISEENYDMSVERFKKSIEKELQNSCG